MRVYLQQQLNNSSINDSLIAQPVERRTVNPQVPGSNPGRGARIHKVLCESTRPFLLRFFFNVALQRFCE